MGVGWRQSLAARSAAICWPHLLAGWPKQNPHGLRPEGNIKDEATAYILPRRGEPDLDQGRVPLIPQIDTGNAEIAMQNKPIHVNEALGRDHALKQFKEFDIGRV